MFGFSKNKFTIHLQWDESFEVRLSLSLSISLYHWVEDDLDLTYVCCEEEREFSIYYRRSLVFEYSSIVSGFEFIYISLSISLSCVDHCVEDALDVIYLCCEEEERVFNL